MFLFVPLFVVCSQEITREPIPVQISKPVLPQETVWVRGIVKDELNQPMAYATVEVRLLVSTTAYKRILCDANGRFEVKLPIQTQYTIIPVYLGYKARPSIQRIAEYLNDESQSVQTYSNAGKYRDYRLNYSKNFKFKKNNSVSFSANGSYMKDKVDQMQTERYSFQSSALYSKSLFSDKLSLSGMFSYMNFWNKGYNGYKFDRPFNLSARIESWSKFKNRNVCYYGLYFSDILNWNNRTKYFIDNGNFSERRTTYKTSVPISVYLSVNWGSFKAKPIRKTKRDAVIQGFANE